MALLISLFAAIICTVVWYKHAPNDTMKVGILCFMYWGLSLMWLIDAVVEYVEVGSAYFNPPPADMLNGSYLGLSVVALGLVVWLVILLVRDPRGVIRQALAKKN